jgi:hypothetical protein
MTKIGKQTGMSDKSGIITPCSCGLLFRTRIEKYLWKNDAHWNDEEKFHCICEEAC